MVSFENKGRCGNFLFQAATAIGYAKKHGLEFTVPARTNNAQWSPIYLPHLINPAFDPSLPTWKIEEARHNYYELPYYEIPPNQRGNIILNGYFQSYKYFDFMRQELLDRFKLPKSKTSGTGLIAVHVRRGDYLLHHPHINPLVPRHFYHTAMNMFADFGYRYFKVFSDDIPWCKEEFSDPDFANFAFTYSENNGIIEDLVDMAACEGIIMSNSTFAWWGAYLNQNPDKTVMCPHEDNYYGPVNKHLDVSTLYPPDWERIKY